ncbi:DNA topoisomerase IB [Pyxidicoccus fallax]|uniref:DNA topoisomerase n=1 Tax=Pyxidicoccus fallax TaxID=394095 RepID=A0A848LGP7_9BACT|nr:DNA topoisomerase IB [Pyxidicoccus fallax]NMO16565.1 DNA topoisomerase IB [Pyxidicoccus fallax]NPC79871.1 DNA topoisomerase IB [Pyxidicoccus fallax]
MMMHAEPATQTEPRPRARRANGGTQLERLQQTGIRRRGSAKRGFRYVRADGRAVSKADRERIDAMRLPPAWTDVAISPSPSARLQAVGRDAAGRWQYRYHETHTRKRGEQKFQRIVDFARALPRMRRRVNADLRKPGLGRDKVLAAMLRILGSCFIRPGSQQYAEENGSFGLATLRRRHVRVVGDTLTFDFPGKSGKQQYRELKDRRVATIVRQLMKVPGRDVFKFVLDDGAVVDVRRRHLNEYIQEVMGPQFSAKDFRTWAGTLICACALARARERVKHELGDETPKPTAIKKTMVAAVKEAAEHLGNTPAVARSSYIYPSVLAMFERGKVVERYFHSVDELARATGEGLHCSEKALLNMLDETKH